MIQKNSILISLGERIRELRKERDFSQEELAYRANVHRTYIGMIERAEKNVTIINLEKIAGSLGVSIETLVKGL
jgi:transcriptional regulator with XRE-family HTH domain